MINREIQEKVEQIALQILKDNNLELVEISLHGKHRPVLTILIDRPSGGITVEECASMNKIISEALDTLDLFNRSYLLEVSSPGVDRPLKTESDFARVINKKIRCFLAEPISQKMEIEGLVNEIDSQNIILDTLEGLITIPYNKINKARQVID